VKLEILGVAPKITVTGGVLDVDAPHVTVFL